MRGGGPGGFGATMLRWGLPLLVLAGCSGDDGAVAGWDALRRVLTVHREGRGSESSAVTGPTPGRAPRLLGFSDELGSVLFRVWRFAEAGAQGR